MLVNARLNHKISFYQINLKKGNISKRAWKKNWNKKIRGKNANNSRQKKTSGGKKSTTSKYSDCWTKDSNDWRCKFLFKNFTV